MSLYVRLHVGFWTHRKTLRLRAAMGNDALWVPLKLWSYAAENQADGDFSEYTAEELAMLLGYAGDAQAMLQALQATGFMDEMRIHDWNHHNEYHAVFSERAKKAAQMRWSKRKEPKEKNRIERKRIEASIASSMLEAFPTLNLEGFEKEWKAFKAHRKTIRHPMSERAEELILSRLSQRPYEAIAAIQHAMIHNWRGFEWAWYDDRKQTRNGAFPHKQPDPKQSKIDKEYEEHRRRMAERKQSEQGKKRS